MVKRFLFILIINTTLFVAAQSPPENLFALKQVNNNIGVGTLSLVDPYLSPFEYKGMFLNFSHERISLLNPNNKNISYTLGSDFSIGRTRHPNSTNSLLFFDINSFAGLNRHFQIQDNMLLLIGSDIDLTLGGKYMSRNINNPFSLNLNSNMNASTKLLYNFSVLDLPIRVSYAFKSPIIGVMFIPLKGLTYYEMYSIGSWSDTFHFSSFHNKHLLKQKLNCDILLNFTTLSLEIKHQHLKYSANNMTFKNNQIGFSIGTVFHFYKFRGNKAKRLNNFVPVL